MSKKNLLSVFSLIMINIIAVNNLKVLPIAAQYGSTLIFFYLLAAITFFIPSALVTAELATGWPNKGGIYIWVREAFGERAAFLSIWLQWVYNVVWYPSILAFLAATFAYLIDPKLAQDKIYTLTMIISLFWLSTILNLYGMKISSWISTLGSILGIIIPTLFITILGMTWFYLGHPLQIKMHWHDLIPNLNNFNNFSFLTAILFGLMGIEMSTVHADEVKNPERNYPKAVMYSVLIILSALISASLAIAIVIPLAQISMVSGVIDAFILFFSAFHLSWMIPIIVILIVIGGVSSISSWIIGPTKGLLIASKDADFPKIFQKTNTAGSPVNILWGQAIIVTLLSTLFLLMPTVSSSYWILTALTSQLALIYYIFIFATAVKLRYSHPHQSRTYKIPGGMIGIWFLSSLAILTCFTVICFGFIPPAGMKIGSLVMYEGILSVGILLFCFTPFLFFKNKSLTTSKDYSKSSAGKRSFQPVD